MVAPLGSVPSGDSSGAGFEAASVDLPSNPNAGGRLTVLSGPSGVGKGTVVAAVRRLYPSIWVSVSVTTRSPRPGEVDGVHYRFVTSAAFERLAADGELLEHAIFAGHGYGTPRGPVEDRVRGGLATLLEIELQGARQVRASDPDAQLVFLVPPSWAELEHRLRGRGTETEAVVAARLARARLELDAVGEFDAQIVNDDVERAAAELVVLVESACVGRSDLRDASGTGPVDPTSAEPRPI